MGGLAMRTAPLTRTAFETALVEAFAAQKAGLPGAADERAAAFSRFLADGLPSRRVEAYHYTDLRQALRRVELLSQGLESGRQDVESLSEKNFLSISKKTHFSASSLCTIAFRDGRIAPLPQLPAGVSVTPLAEALGSGALRPGITMGGARDSVVDLNTVFMREGCVIKISGQVGVPLHLAFETQRRGHLPLRVIVQLAPGARATLVQSHSGPEDREYFENSVVELVLGEAAVTEHIRVQEAGNAALALSTLAVSLAARAELSSIALVSGGALSRHQVFATFAGENARLSLSGASMIKDRQHCDTTLVVDHAVPHGESRELFRTVADGSAQGVFQGKIIVRRHAQKTDGQMASNAILLSDDAGMSNKPELEIFADDVVCAHGATCGALDDEQLFYLMARGLPRAEAETLLVEAFLDEVFDKVCHEAIREALAARVSRWMQSRSRG